MDKSNSLISPEIQEILQGENIAQRLKELFFDMHSYDVFVLCEDLENSEVAQCIKALGIPTGIELFQEFDDERKEDIFDCFSKEWMADILEEMASDERADFVKFLPDEKLERVLPLIARAERIDIKKLSEYKEGTAGSILTTEYASLSPDITVREALEKLKRQAFDRETIYYIYIVDSNRTLIGFVSLRDILLAPSHNKIEDIMHKIVISMHVDDDNEIVAKKLSDYDFLAIPVVDDGNRLVGIVTVDDVVDVVIEESTEDIYKYGAAGEYIDYMKSSPLQMARQRVVWLILLIFVGFISAWVLEANSFHIKTVVALSFFMPLLLGASGNAGTQASTVVVRELATGNIKIEDLFQVVKKEVSVGVVVGTIMAIVVALRALWLDENPKVGITVGLAMIMTVTLATTLGAFLPILFKKLKFDPAVMSGPFITSIIDVVSLLIYFRIATLIFG
ncbi:MAG: magnesium transporter [Candidatus Omnitrophica bacterium]|nr:magnesium transporter [Candidatus Omnitrophota bacterium]